MKKKAYTRTELREIAKTVSPHYPPAGRAIRQLLRELAAREKGESQK